MPRTLCRPLPKREDHGRDEYDEYSRGSVATQRQTSVTGWLVKKITEHRTEGSRQDECYPEQRGSRNPRPETGCSDDREK